MTIFIRTRDFYNGCIHLAIIINMKSRKPILPSPSTSVSWNNRSKSSSVKFSSSYLSASSSCSLVTPSVSSLAPKDLKASMSSSSVIYSYISFSISLRNSSYSISPAPSSSTSAIIFCTSVRVRRRPIASSTTRSSSALIEPSRS